MLSLAKFLLEGVQFHVLKAPRPLEIWLQLKDRVSVALHLGFAILNFGVLELHLFFQLIGLSVFYVKFLLEIFVLAVPVLFQGVALVEFSLKAMDLLSQLVVLVFQLFLQLVVRVPMQKL